MQLCLKFNHLEPNWMNKYVIMIDNARYHRSKMVIELMRILKIPVMYTGPYSFDMAPVEMLFRKVKCYQLNP
jgi:transposase